MKHTHPYFISSDEDRISIILLIPPPLGRTYKTNELITIAIRKDVPVNRHFFDSSLNEKKFLIILYIKKPLFSDMTFRHINISYLIS